MACVDELGRLSGEARPALGVLRSLFIHSQSFLPQLIYSPPWWIHVVSLRHGIHCLEGGLACPGYPVTLTKYRTIGKYLVRMIFNSMAGRLLYLPRRYFIMKLRRTTFCSCWFLEIFMWSAMLASAKGLDPVFHNIELTTESRGSCSTCVCLQHLLFLQNGIVLRNVSCPQSLTKTFHLLRWCITFLSCI